eukprot:TRINITY_DN67990_c7_g4_i3.p1 TRINITY_DN67990_c7_g4~~TRINITY_DN67990_c7_g4_i3.p1  ORF type:complete len:230 (-),score=8.90 TRINITY_DN67990_c7_g4_i3:170-859(-)
MSLLFSLASVVDLTKWNELNMQSWVDMLEPFGYPVDDKFFADHLCEQTDGEILQGLMPMTTAMEFDSLQNTRQKFLEEQIPRLEFTPVPGVVDLLHDARQNSASPYTAYIMTNIGNESIRDTILSKAGLQNMFDGCFQYGSRTSMVHETVEQLKQQRDGNIATYVFQTVTNCLCADLSSFFNTHQQTLQSKKPFLWASAQQLELLVLALTIATSCLRQVQSAVSQTTAT